MGSRRGLAHRMTISTWPPEAVGHGGGNIPSVLVRMGREEQSVRANCACRSTHLCAFLSSAPSPLNNGRPSGGCVSDAARPCFLCVFLPAAAQLPPTGHLEKPTADRFAWLQGQDRYVACRADSVASNNRRSQAAEARIAYRTGKWVGKPDTHIRPIDSGQNADTMSSGIASWQWNRVAIRHAGHGGIE